MKQNLPIRKIMIRILPYGIIGLFCTDLGKAWRLAAGADMTERMTKLMKTIPASFRPPVPSFHPFDLVVGVSCAVTMATILWGTDLDTQQYVLPSISSAYRKTSLAKKSSKSLFPQEKLTHLSTTSFV